jgi:hypothetical protein
MSGLRKSESIPCSIWLTATLWSLGWFAPPRASLKDGMDDYSGRLGVIPRMCGRFRRSARSWVAAEPRR